MARMRSYRRRNDDRAGETRGIGGFLGAERARLMDAATPQQIEQRQAAERRRDVFAAWNAVAAGTREGKHATGLHYVAERNELIVYMDSPSWTQEMTLLREIIRARMAVGGVHVEAIAFKTSREGYGPSGVAPDPGAAADSEGTTPASRAATARYRHRPDPSHPTPRPPAPRAPLSSSEAAALDAEVAPIADARLRQALKNAIKASLEWKKGTEESKRA